MRISKYYEENVNLGNYQFARIGLTISSDIDIKGEDELREVSARLLQMAKTVVREELDIIKKERGA